MAAALARAGDACANVLAARARSFLLAGLKSAGEQLRAAEAGVQREPSLIRAAFDAPVRAS